MGKSHSSSIGIDIGTHSVKGVLLLRRGQDRAAIAQFAIRSFGGAIENADQLAHHLKLLLAELGSARAVGISMSASGSLVRIIEQPATPPALLRRALQINGLIMLNQDVANLVVDCDEIPGGTPEESALKNQKKYLVCGVNRERVNIVIGALKKIRTEAQFIQLSPVSILNAFEISHSQIFAEETFMLVDLGHSQSTVMVGSKKELLLVRNVDFGGHALVQALTSNGGIEAESAMLLFNQGDPGMLEIAHQELSAIARELRSSIGFIEGQREEVIHKIHISGGLAKSEQILQLMSDETNIPFELWDPFETCEHSLPKSRAGALEQELGSLTAAYGAALEAMFPA